MSEGQIVEERQSLGRLQDALKKNWDEIVVDVGSGNSVSTNVEKKTLLVLVDPTLDELHLDYGDNDYPEGEVITIKGEASDVSQLLDGKVDRVQIIGPDPDFALRMIKDSVDMVKPRGEMVLVFDLYSNKNEQVDGVIDDIKAEIGSEFEKEIFKPDDVDDLVEFVGGEINSDFIFDRAKVVILTRK